MSSRNDYLGIDQVTKEAEHWGRAHPKYKFWKHNCRSFTDSMLRKIVLGEGKLADTLKTGAFRDSPTKACEHYLDKHADDEPRVLRSPSQ